MGSGVYVPDSCAGWVTGASASASEPAARSAEGDGLAVAARQNRVRPFDRKFRLRTRQHLALVKEKGANRVGRRCIVAALEPPDGQRRFAIVVSRRYSLLAVQRNRARRLLRETYRLLLPELKPAWLVFIPRHSMKTATLGEVLPDARRLLDAVGVLKPPSPGTEGPAA